MARVRLDQALVLRGFAPSRAQAQAAIDAGLVRVEGEVCMRASQRVAPDCALEAEAPHPWVSRGGVKLAHALNQFGVDPAGRVCLDVGASTGGFTHVLLARGARVVHAIDVGRGQLHPMIAADPRVCSKEGFDARNLDATHLPEPPSLIVADVSFIGLLKAIAQPLRLAALQADVVALVKPQFEAGPGRAPDGETAAAVAEATAAGLEGVERFHVLGLIESPIRGGEGAREFLLHARRNQ